MESNAFGETTIKTQTTKNNLRFPGQYADSEIGLSQNYFRDYAPNLGRYVESGPIGLRGGVNTFEYVEQRVTIGHDKLGLFFDGIPFPYGPELPPPPPNWFPCSWLCNHAVNLVCYTVGIVFIPKTGGWSLLGSVICSEIGYRICNGICTEKPKCGE